MAKEIPNWGNIPMDIASEIREHIELYDDYEAFAEVCSSWRLATKEFRCEYINRKHTQLPWLMLADEDNSSYRRYYSLTKHQFRKIYNPPCPSPPQPTRYFSSRGWLISVSIDITKTIGRDYYFNITIFNPFSNNNVVIEAPMFHFHDEEASEWEDKTLLRLFTKFAISTSPNNVADDFIVAMSFGPMAKIAYWRLGHDDTWVQPSSWVVGLIHLFEDVCFFRGELYAIQYNGTLCKVVAFGDVMDPKNDHKPRLVVNLGDLTNIYEFPDDMEDDDSNYYMVESKDDDSLFVIHRYILVESWEENKSKTVAFNVFKLDVDTGNLENVKSLGDQAIFLGYNSAFAVKVDGERGCEGDCIYYTDDHWEMFAHEKKRGGGNMGIYNLREGKFIPVYQGPSQFGVINPPLWIECSTA